MFGLEPWALGLIAFALAMAGVVKGVIGIGLPIVTIVILSHFLDAHLVLAIVTLPILFTNLWQAVGSGSLLTPLKRFWPMILCLVLGIVFAAQLAAAVDTDVLYGLMGISVVVFAVTSYIRPSGGLKETTERWAGPLAGAIGGILGGVSTIWGPPMMMYFLLAQTLQRRLHPGCRSCLVQRLPALGGKLRRQRHPDPRDRLALSSRLPASHPGPLVGRTSARSHRPRALPQSPAPRALPGRPQSDPKGGVLTARVFGQRRTANNTNRP